MTINGWLQILFFFALILAVTKPLGVFMTRVFNRERTFLDPVLRPIERLIYRLTGINEEREMRWTEYAVAMFLFSGVSMLVLYGLQRLQYYLPFNPQKLAGIIPHSSFNTAASFTTNTNWQSYVPETTMSYLSQMAGLAYHNFVSAAVGIALAIAFIRGIARREKDTLGNFWVDMTRATLWVLLPISLVGALVFVASGVPQNLKPYDMVKLVDPQTVQVDKKDASGNVINGPDGKPLQETQAITEQTIAQGPVASQEIIKELGTNGGGFFNTNSSHPFENPTPFTNLLEMISIFAISAGLTYTLGRMTGSQRHGWAVFAAMAFLFFVGITVAYWAEAKGNPLLAGVDQTPSAMQSGGNMEGKEVRYGIANSTLWATVTTDTSCGAVNSMHDSYTPLGGLVPLANMQLSEVVFGGVGSGMYGMLVMVILSVFIAGLMVGRTPEYLGKKVESYDVKMAMLNVLIFPLTILVFTAISTVSASFGTSAISNPGPHGLSEILYAYTESGLRGGTAVGVNTVPKELRETVDRIAKAGGTPLVVAENYRALGVIYLKDIVKGGMKERFDQLRAMGIKTVMITGDNPLTAATIAREAGVDDFLAEAKPEDKMALIKFEQGEGKLVAMAGDGTNDAPALAQADVGVAMNTGTQAAKEAGNMVDLDSNPTKLIEVVEIGKQLLMTRGALTTFSIANDVAKYFAIIPAMFSVAFPVLNALNIMRLATPQSAILSAVIFNALIIIALIPLALKGVKYRSLSAATLLRRNLLIYGLGGVIIPFIGIKLIDLIIVAIGLA